MNRILGWDRKHTHQWGEFEGRRTCSICGATLYLHILPGGQQRWMTIPTEDKAEEYIQQAPQVQRLAKCVVCNRILPDIGFENGVCKDCQH